MKTNLRELFLGLDYYGRFPILVPRSLFHGHAWIVGATGMGKTVMIMSLLLQLAPEQRYGPAGVDERQEASQFRGGHTCRLLSNGSWRRVRNAVITKPFSCS